MKEVVLEELSGTVPVPIEVDVSVEEADEGERVSVGGYGEGSREALERTGGDRSGDEQRDRRVGIEAELATTERRTDRIKMRKSARTRDWLFTITRFRDFGLGYAKAELDIEIKNPLSGKVATGTAILRGAGRGGLAPDAGGIGKRDIRLRTDREIGFRDFHGRGLRLYMVSIKLIYGWRRLYLVFAGLRSEPVLLERKSGWGMPGGYGVFGELSLHSIPEDFSESEHESEPYKRKTGLGESLSVLFDTGLAKIKSSDVSRIREFAAMWAKRLH